MIVYKGVRAYTDDAGVEVWRSITRYHTNRASVIYKIGEEALPADGCGPLAAFESLKVLLDFLHLIWSPTGECWQEARVLRCESEIIEDYTHLPPEEWRTPLSLWTTDAACWRYGMSLADLPPGTVLCGSITPIKQLFLPSFESVRRVGSRELAELMEDDAP